MTALNVWIKPKAGYIACDGAAYSVADGRILEIREKVIVLERQRIAIGMMGVCHLDQLSTALARHPLTTQADVKAALPESVHAVWKANAALYPLLNDDWLAISVKLVCWNPTTNRAEVSILGTHPKYLMAGQNPWMLYTGQSSLLHPDLEDGGGFSELDPETQALEVLERQRRAVTMDALDGTPFAMVGGVATLYRVNAAGVSKRTLHTWPDKIGERIEREPINRFCHAPGRLPDLRC